MNPGKFQFMILRKSVRQKYFLKIGLINVKGLDHVELLGMTMDKHSSFKKHIENLCRNANYKLHALRHIKKIFSCRKSQTTNNAIIDSQFNYAP